MTYSLYYEYMFLSDLAIDTAIDPLSNINILTSNTTVLGMPSWFCWVLIGIMLLISGLFSASENAFSNCNKYHFKVLADEGKLTAKIIVRLTEKFEDTLVSILVSNNIVQTLMSYLSAILFYNMFKATSLANYEALISTLVMAVLVYVISDTVPKILSKAIPNRMVYLLAWPDFIMSILLYPLIIVFRGILKLVHIIFKIKDENMLTKEDFIEKADEAISDVDINNESGQLFEENEIDMLNNAFSFDTIKANHVMTPFNKMEMINIDGITIPQLNEKIMNSNYSRFPVYEENKNNIVGILSVNNYFKEFAIDSHLDIRSVISKPLFVDESMTVNEIFDQINKEKVHLAIVKNNKNEILGMITMDDILDELVDEKGFFKKEVKHNI